MTVYDDDGRTDIAKCTQRNSTGIRKKNGRYKPILRLRCAAQKFGQRPNKASGTGRSGVN